MPSTPDPQQIIALVVRQNTAGIEEPVARILGFLQGSGSRVVFEADTATHLGLPGVEPMSVADIGEQADLAVVMGGDGTMLGIARQLAKYDIPLIGIDDLQKIIPLGCTPVAVELVDGARPLPEYTHPDRAIYIFGPEDGSLDQSVRDWCEDTIYIPTTGCMNLAATVNVVLYDRLAKGNNTRSGPKFK